jgi:predicted HicB family RNase H-like nuclease
MDLTPYLESLRRDLHAVNPELAEQVAVTLESSIRLCLMEALSDAAAEITDKLDTSVVDVRIRGRDAELVVTELPRTPEPEPAPTWSSEGSGDVARITLRLPEGLKESVEQTAAREGISVNAWLVRAIGAAVSGWSGFPPPPPPPPPFPPGRASFGKRVTGYAQA